MDLEKIKEIAAEQHECYIKRGGCPERYIGFLDGTTGKFIVNPWLDPSGEKELSMGEAIDKYGLLNMLNFINKIATKRML